MRWSVAAATGLALSQAMILAGCSSDKPEAAPTPPPATSSVPPVTATPPATPTPSDAREDPVDFLERWYSANDDAQKTGDVEEAMSMQMRCAGCRDSLRLVRKIYRAGGVIEFGGVTGLKIVATTGADNVYVATGTALPTRYKDSKESRWERIEGGRFRHRFSLEALSGRWVIIAAERLPA